MGYFKTAVKSVSWVALFRGVTKGVALIRTLILARILTPTQFGLFGVAILILGLLEMLTETGINVFIVQEEEDNTLAEHLNTAWVISIVRGLIIGAIILIAAPFIAAFFHKPEATALVRLMAVVPFLRGLINPAVVNLQKHLRFSQEFLLKSSIAITDATIAITLALAWRNPISLIIGMAAGVCLEVAISLLFIKPTPRFAFRLSHFRTITGRGKWITAGGILNYIANQGSDYTIGRFINTTALGLYQMAFSLSQLAVNEINEIFNHVNFPIYAKIAGDKKRLTKAFIKHSLVTITLLTPVTIVLTLFPEQCIRLVAGPQWIAAAPLIKGLAVYAFIINIVASCYPLFLAVKKQQYLTLVTFVQGATIAIAIIPLVRQYQLMGAVYALIIASITILPLKFFLIRKCLVA